MSNLIIDITLPWKSWKLNTEQFTKRLQSPQRTPDKQSNDQFPPPKCKQWIALCRKNRQKLIHCAAWIYCHIKNRVHVWCMFVLGSKERIFSMITFVPAAFKLCALIWTQLYSSYGATKIISTLQLTANIGVANLWRDQYFADRIFMPQGMQKPCLSHAALTSTLFSPSTKRQGSILLHSAMQHSVDEP